MTKRAWVGGPPHPPAPQAEREMHVDRGLLQHTCYRTGDRKLHLSSKGRPARNAFVLQLGSTATLCSQAVLRAIATWTRAVTSPRLFPLYKMLRMLRPVTTTQYQPTEGLFEIKENQNRAAREDSLWSRLAGRAAVLHALKAIATYLRAHTSSLAKATGTEA